MYMKLGLFQIKNNILLNIFIIIQLAVVIAATVSITSVYSYYYSYYGYFSDYFSSEGYYYMAERVSNKFETYCSSDKMEEDLKKAEVISTYSAGIGYDNGSGETITSMTLYAYDNEFVERYSPELKSGVWLSEAETENGVIPAVISETASYKVGDVLEVEVDDSRNVSIKIVGMLAGDTYIVGHPNSVTMSYDYTDVYSNINTQPYMTLFFNFDDIKDDAYSNVLGVAMTDEIFVIYDDDISDEDIEYNEEWMEEHIYYDVKMSMEYIRENSWETLLAEIINTIPIFICALILTIISAICVNTIIVKEQLKNYAIYNMVGMGWKKCKLINLCQAVFIGIFSVILCGVLGVAAYLKGIQDFTMIGIDLYAITGMLAVILLYVLVAVFVPSFYVTGKTVKDVIIK